MNHKKIINLIFFLSIIVFAATGIFYFKNKQTIALGVGSGGGRIGVTMLPRSPDCTPQICTCNSTFLASLFMSGGSVSSICFPLENMPNVGPPVTMGSIGMQILGFFPVTEGMMESSNWGTSL
ncbi:MAG: hypothetical protein U9R06_02010 [Patescibacteria group bacterium]|nr:hypothetical protein [Patescibacteria group bacterium]